MPFFLLEMYDDKGKVIEKRHINMDGVNTVEKALKHVRAMKMKREAMVRGFAFRCKREDS